MEAIWRKSNHNINKIYFFTATINNWQPLLAGDNNKQLIVDYPALVRGTRNKRMGKK
jgi:hypothetical protein